ncbi:MAG: DUF1573 domain-containing protein [Paludibacteraceae bacterium]|nr:DUF1573 domain-containing protein [Paludibacteraceae bacterium]
MKKIFSTLFMALVAVAMMGQQPVITFEKTEHDFGKIHEEDGRVSVVFEFKNEGMAPLVLSNVRASCGCTTPTWTKEPVEPGQTGSITVTYNPNGRPGRFQKTVTITSNASEPTTKVFIKGEVIPKPAKPVNKYTIAVGELNMKTLVLDLGTVKKGENKTGELEYANLGQAEHKVELATNPVFESYMISQVTLENIKPNETGKFIFALDTKATKLYGPIEVNAYVVVDGKKELSDTYKLTIKANIVEDFSNMTVEQKQQAPIIELAEEFNAGKIAAGKAYKFAFSVKNTGVNPLEIHRVYSTDAHLNPKAPKPVKSGKKGAVYVDINTKGLEPGSYSREVVIICNDYMNPIKKVKINFIVE